MSTSSIYGAAAAPITISGLASGLDTSSIITALTNEESGVETQLQTQQTTLNSALTEWQTIGASLSGLQGIAQTLEAPSTFDSQQASIDQTAVASVTASSTATTGTHTLTVSSLAQAQKVLSTGFSDESTPLNISGTFTLNGKTVTIASTDTLNNVVTKINSASAGVTASIVSASTGNYQLSLTGNSTGALNAISASDSGGGTVLESLGLISTGATESLRQSVTSGGDGGAGSIAFSNASQNIGVLTGAAAGSAADGTIQINGTSVAVDLNTMSLTDVANAINAAGITGVKAQLVGIPDSNGNVSPSSQQQLQIISTTTGAPLTASSFTDSNGVLSSLGILQSGFTDQVSAAQDAAFTLDGVNYTRSSNTVNDAIAGVNMTLLSTNNSTTSTPANISVSQNTTAITSTVNNFITAYNGVVDGINAQMTFTPTSTTATGTAQAAPPLFGDFTLTNIQNQLTSMLNVTSGSTTLASLGISVSSTGDLSLNSSTLATALASNPQSVSGFFSAAGSTTTSALNYIAAGTNTVTSSSEGYDVNITQAPAQATVTATTPYQTLTQPETLTFSGGLFGSADSPITLATGTTLADAISDINNNSTLSQYLYASQDSNGDLMLSSKGYGSNQSFTIASNVSGAGTSGIGQTGITATGTDVAGTINGEAATGDGQALIGNAGNATTDGLQITYTGTSTGDVGNVIVTQGLGSQLYNYLNSATDTTTGVVTTAETAITSQVTDLQTQITEQQTEVANYEAQLTTEFNNMETAISTLQSQQDALNAETASLTDTGASADTSGTSSSSGSSSSGATASTST